MRRVVKSLARGFVKRARATSSIKPKARCGSARARARVCGVRSPAGTRNGNRDALRKRERIIVGPRRPVTISFTESVLVLARATVFTFSSRPRSLRFVPLPPPPSPLSPECPAKAIASECRRTIDGTIEMQMVAADVISRPRVRAPAPVRLFQIRSRAFRRTRRNTENKWRRYKNLTVKSRPLALPRPFNGLLSSTDKCSGCNAECRAEIARQNVYTTRARDNARIRARIGDEVKLKATSGRVGVGGGREMSFFGFLFSLFFNFAANENSHMARDRAL